MQAPKGRNRRTGCPSALEEDATEDPGVLAEALAEFAVVVVFEPRFELVPFTLPSVYLVCIQLSHRLLHHGENEGKKTLTQS